ncbi:MAG: hypothetical protein KFF50_02810, partial [Desulfatitalea sp.]|nr:hypothetical protein [Desulfatitalea sp.]
SAACYLFLRSWRSNSSGNGLFPMKSTAIRRQQSDNGRCSIGKNQLFAPLQVTEKNRKASMQVFSIDKVYRLSNNRVTGNGLHPKHGFRAVVVFQVLASRKKYFKTRMHSCLMGCMTFS